MGTFSLKINDYVDKSINDMVNLRDAIIIELFLSVILDTPVLQGRLRGNWIISSNNPASGTLEISETDANSESKSRSDGVRGKVTTTTVNNVFEHLTKLPKGKDSNVYLTNNLPYAYRIEYDGWSHTKSPEGMVRKNFARIVQNLKA